MSWYYSHKRICKSCNYAYTEDISTFTIIDKDKRCPKCGKVTNTLNNEKSSNYFMDRVQNKLNTQQ
jgi:rubredoxin